MMYQAQFGLDTLLLIREAMSGSWRWRGNFVVRVFEARSLSTRCVIEIFWARPSRYATMQILDVRSEAGRLRSTGRICKRKLGRLASAHEPPIY